MTTCDPTSLLAAAACFDCIPSGMADPVATYLLCQIANLSANADPTNLLAGATYSGSVHRYTKLGLNDGGQYKIVWGASDYAVSNGVNTIQNPGSGYTSLINVGKTGTLTFYGIANGAITAQLFLVQ